MRLTKCKLTPNVLNRGASACLDEATSYERMPQPRLEHPAGQLNLRIPKLRTGSYFPSFLEARKTTEKALVSVIQEA